MVPIRANIIFLDNSLNSIYKTIEALKKLFIDTHIFIEEKDFFDHLENNPVDIIFINLDVKPNDGIFICKEIRQKNIASNPFIIIYNKKQDDFVQELAFNSGADSFINFYEKTTVMEIYIRNLLRRRVTTKNTLAQKLFIDNERYLIFQNGEPFQLPPKEFKLFEFLYNNSEIFWSKLKIANIIWQDEEVAKKRTIDVHIYNIRKLFGRRIIQSQKGKGYRLVKKMGI